jgi:hypothetical protein
MTTQVTLSPTVWTTLGAGPMLLSALGGPLAFQVGSSQPALGTFGHTIQAADRPVDINSAATVWALQLIGTPGFVSSAIVSTVTS